MGKIGDLFVRLGLKKDEYSKGIQEAKGEAKGFGESIRGLSAMAINAWMEIGQKLLSLADTFVHTSQRFGDAWDQTMGRMKAAWNTFISSLNSWNWENFGQRIRNAMDAGARSVAAHDMEMEVRNSIEIQKALAGEELANLRIRMQNQRLSYAEREKAAKDYLEKMKPIYQAEIDLREGIYQADTGSYLSLAGLGADSQKQLERFFTSVAPNAALLDALDALSRGTMASNIDDKLIAEFQKRIGTTDVSAYAKIAELYKNESDASNQAVADAIKGRYAALSAEKEENRRIYQVLNSAGAMASKTQVASVEDLLQDAEARMDAVTDRAISLADKEITEAGKEIIQLAANEKVQWQPLEIVPVDQAALQAVIDQMEYLKKSLVDLDEVQSKFHEALVEGFSAGIQELTDQLFNLEEANPGKVFQALLTPLADMTVQMGELLITQGLGLLAVKAGFESMNPYAMLAAGAALVAIGAATKSGLAAIGNSAGNGTTASTYEGGSSALQTQMIQNELTVHVEGRISGSDIVLSGSRTVSKYNR